MSTDNKNLISSANFQEISGHDVLRYGQRIIRIGDRMLPVGIGGSSAVQGGSDPAIPLAMVIHYNPYSAAYDQVVSAKISGFGMIGETDYSAVNGTFYVTDETGEESDPVKRIYQNGEYFLYWYSEMGDRIYGRWYIGKTAGSAYIDVVACREEFSEELPAGTASWNEQINWSAISVTVETKVVTVPAVEERLTAAAVTDYDPENREWSVGGEIEVNSYEQVPAADEVYAVKGGRLIGAAIGSKYPETAPSEPAGNVDGSWVCAASSSIDSDRTAYQAFVCKGNEWHSASGHPQWLWWRNLDYRCCIKRYTLYNRPDGACQSLEWKIQGSDNGIDWTDIDHVVLESAEYGSVYAREIAENTKFFRMHRFYSMRANDNYTTVEFFTARGKYAADSTDDAAYQVSGAGTADANGYYWDSGTVTDGGYPVFTNGLCKFYRTDAANCCIASIANRREYYNVRIPECTVSVYNGDSPAPEVRIL